MAIFSSLKDNYLMATLTAADCANFRKDLELVEIQSQQNLNEPNAPAAYVYFPTTSIVSLMCLTEDGVAVEIGVVGREGVVGTAHFLGGMSSVRSIVQRAGFAYRLRADIFKREFDRNAAIQRACFRYTQVLLTQVAQSVLCNRCHSVDQHLCRWLLDNLDRMSSNELSATHESIANMLGVRRESVTASAGKLKSAGLISAPRPYHGAGPRCAGGSSLRVLPDRAQGIRQPVGRVPCSERSRTPHRYRQSHGCLPAPHGDSATDYHVHPRIALILDGQPRAVRLYS
jgi:CRP-like cAMP-binding protein